MRRFKSTFLVTLAGIGLPSAATRGADIDLDASCPAQATAGQTVTVNFTLKNEECTAQDVRLISSVVGNSNQTLGSLGVYGPVVAESSIILPAATDLLSGDCAFNECEGATDYIWCDTDADCVCRETVPSTTDFQLATPPTLSPDLAGTVATFVFLVGPAGSEAERDHCMVEVLP